MPVIALLDSSSTGNTGALASDSVFYIAKGKVLLSSDGGTTKIPWETGEKVAFSSGLTVHYENASAGASEIRFMPL